MNNFKSHFTFSKQQRSGIFLLLFLIVVLQCVYYFVDFSSEDIAINNTEFNSYLNEIDSLKAIELENKKPKIYPFNPNFITDYKGYTLGMSNEEIDRLLAFRKQDKWVNSSKEFQQVTKISDSLLNVISPFFKFPDWVNKPKTKIASTYSNNNIPKTEAQKIDLNIATAAQLQKVYGIGEKLSKRIVDYRIKNKAFIATIELSEVYGLTPEVIENIQKDFSVKTPKQVKKIALNTATSNELVTVKYIDYEIAHNIIEQRTLREGFKSFDELAKVKAFPLNKFEIIKLYLTLN